MRLNLTITAHIALTDSQNGVSCLKYGIRVSCLQKKVWVTNSILIGAFSGFTDSLKLSLCQ